MGDSNMQRITVDVPWEEILDTLVRFLKAATLAPAITDKQLVDLMTACDNTRQRLRENSGG